MKNKIKPTEVLIVHCIDTEGPMYESLEATFERINKIFNLDLDCSEENLKLIQNNNYAYEMERSASVDIDNHIDFILAGLLLNEAFF